MPKPTAKMTRKQIEYFDYMKTIMAQLEWDMHDEIYRNGRIPAAWHEIAQTRHAGKKTRITLCVEENVVRFFKSMGAGYQTRMNEVLAAWMYSRMAGLLSGRDTVPEFVDQERPQFAAPSTEEEPGL